MSTQPIPDGTLCLIVNACPEFAHYIGHTVKVFYDEVVSNDWRKNAYKMCPPKLTATGCEIFGEDKCLLPITPKDDDNQETITKEKDRDTLTTANV